MEKEMKYVAHYRWYMVANYLVALAETIAAYKYTSNNFFWAVLILNVLGVIGCEMKMTKLEKKFGLDV